jgi:hypothetical protein
MAQEREVSGYLLFGVFGFQIGLGLRFPDDDGCQRRIEGINVGNEALDPVRLLGSERSGQVIDDPERGNLGMFPPDVTDDDLTKAEWVFDSAKGYAPVGHGVQQPRQGCQRFTEVLGQLRAGVLAQLFRLRPWQGVDRPAEGL